MPFTDQLAHLDDQQLKQLNQILEQFAASKKANPETDLQSFLPRPKDSLRPLALQALIVKDMELQWRRNHAVFLEQYLRSCPEVGDADNLSPHLLHEEYNLRQRYGDQPSLESYQSRFPKQFKELEELVQGLPQFTKHGDNQHTPTPAENKGEVLHAGPAGGYKLLEKLGGGNFGQVWKVQTPGGMTAALKVITWPMNHPATQRELTSLELIKVKELRHIFLLSIRAFHEMDDRLAIEMALADCSLRDRLNEVRRKGEKGIPAKELLSYMKEAAEALDYLHSQEVLHRDIKPENLLLLNGHMQVADLGLARLVDAAQHGAASILGTPPYMAPEAWRSIVHRNSDQYSLAVTYIELRRGQCPFKNANTEGLLPEHLADRPDLAPLTDLERQVLLKAGAKDLKDRYPSCLDFVRALEEAVNPKPAMGYQKIRRLGRGTFGEVWQGEAPGGIPVAIKVIPFADQEKARHELDGMDLIKGLSHPHLIRLYASWLEGDDVYMAMELAEGNLREKMEQCQLRGEPGIPVKDLLKYTQQAASALDYLHDRKVIHRDIKPENIMLVGGYAKIGDFSVVRSLQEQSMFEATTSGTLPYMPPEIWRGKATRHSDQYSLAATYAELRMGRSIFKVGSLAEAMEAHLNRSPDLGELPEGERQVLKKALAKNPAERYGSCSLFADALQQALDMELTPPPPEWIRQQLADRETSTVSQHGGTQRANDLEAVSDRALQQNKSGIVHRGRGDKQDIVLQSFSDTLSPSLDVSQGEVDYSHQPDSPYPSDWPAESVASTLPRIKPSEDESSKTAAGKRFGFWTIVQLLFLVLLALSPLAILIMKIFAAFGR